MKVISTLVVILIVTTAFISGLFTNISIYVNDNPELSIKESVLDLVAYPTAASFRNIRYFPFREINNKKIGFYCGEVYGFDDGLPYGYKRFFIRTIKYADGTSNIGIPVVEKIEDMVTQKEFDQLWKERCDTKMNS